MMISRALILGLLTCAGLLAQAPAPAPASADNTAATEESQPASPAGVPSTTAEAQPPAPKKPRAISSDLATQLAASMPKYNPPKSKEPAPEKDEAEVPADQPKNQIIRLPRVVVEGERPPVFTEREVNTQKGLAELAVKRYFSETGLALNRFRLPLIGMTKEQYAMMLYEQDERLRQLNDAKDDISILRQTDPAAAERLQDDVNSTFIRSSGFGEIDRNRR